MERYVINTFSDIVYALKENPDWREEMRRLILTDKLINLPEKFDNFLEYEFKPLKKDVEILKKDVEILKKDVEILKKDVEILKNDVEVLKKDVGILKKDVSDLKGDNFERKVREKAPAFFGKLLRKTRVINIEDFAEALDEANEKGYISDKERDDALNVDVVVKGRIKGTDREVILIGEVSVTVDNEDVERASRRARIFSKVFNKEAIGTVIGQQVTDRAVQLSDKLSVLIV